MPPVLTEAARPSKKRSRIADMKGAAHDGAWALRALEKHILMDGFKVVIDLEKSRGSYLYDATTGRRLIDFYGFFGSLTIGFNHPYFDEPAVKEDLLRAAKFKIANSDVYSEGYAEFVDTLSRVAGFPPLDRYLFIEGGALAIENTLKAAMDWKVRKNMAAGRGERGTEILHFRRAFHGRSGYTMSLTNTDPRKTDLFAKFNWPRVSNPSIDFSLPEPRRTEDVIAREKKCEQEVMKFIAERGPDIAAIIIEPIQGEGGDNHFRGEWLHTLRRIIEEEKLVANAAKVGAHFLSGLQELQRAEPIVSAVRGRGLFLAFNLPDPKTREEFWKGVFDRGALVLKSGERAIRFRPALDISTGVIDEAMELLRQQCRQMRP